MTKSVPLDGPIHDVAWSPTANEFIAVYGSMPAKAVLYNRLAEKLFSFGTGSYNSVVWSPHGRFVCLVCVSSSSYAMHVSSTSYDMHASSSSYDLHASSSSYDMHVSSSSYRGVSAIWQGAWASGILVNVFLWALV